LNVIFMISVRRVVVQFVVWLLRLVLTRTILCQNGAEVHVDRIKLTYLYFGALLAVF
jgi:hypothetical protein